MDKKLINSHTFTIEVKVPSSEEFSGSFTIHRPTIGERIRIGVIEAQELAGLSNVDMVVSQLAHVVAVFDVVIDLAPPWWKPRELREMEVLQAVYQKYVDYLQEFQIKSQPQTTG